MQKKEICIVMIAHNQIKQVQQGIRNIGYFTDSEKVHIVIVDNASQDGLSEWLQSQKIIDYILCGEKVESYALILNTVRKEFACDKDIFVLSPDLLLLPNCLDNLQEILYREQNTGAVCAEILANNRREGESFETALSHAEKLENETYSQVISVSSNNVLFRHDFISMLGDFDEEIILPENVLLDYSFRGICMNYQFFCVHSACLYQLVPSKDIYFQKFGSEIDQAKLKSKWGMNYFNHYPNQNLINVIQRSAEEKFDLLEVGCDCGVNLLQIHNQYNNANLYGIEINERAAEIAGHLAQVSVGNIEEGLLPFEDAKFDYIMFGDVLEHLKNPRKVVLYCRRLLKKNGRIIACIPNLMHYSVMHDLINGYFSYTDAGLLDKTHIHFFTYNEIVRMFQTAGYNIEHIGYTGGISWAGKQEQKFVQQLMKISTGAEEFMFYAFQYIVSAYCNEK